jgi:hypothetical protein
MSNPLETEIPAVLDRGKWRPGVSLVLVLLLVVIVAIATGLGAGPHWMQGPAIGIMVSFMPLTAITYLHYRLPRKQEEFEAISRTLGGQANDPEMFSIVFHQEESAADYFLPIFFVSFFSTMGFYILFADLGAVLFNAASFVEEPHNVYTTEAHRRNIVAIAMAFLGAYIWSIQYIFRRMMTLDLPPGAYFSVGTRMIYSTFLAVVFQYLLVGTEVGGTSQVVVVSFLTGIFPERVLSWMRDSAGQIFAKPKISAPQLPLEMIEGISGFHKARLFELGIDGIQNLAHASLLELILKTPFKARVLVDWMAQARLCLEFNENTNKIRAAGIRTILDLQEVFEANDNALVETLAENSGVNIDLIRTVYVANKEEISISRLRKAYDLLNMV